MGWLYVPASVASNLASDCRRPWRVPKPVLQRPLIVAVETGRLKVAAGLPFADALTLELRAFERTVTRHANEQFEGRGQHDDLVIACALVCWRAEMAKSGRLTA